MSTQGSNQKVSWFLKEHKAKNLNLSPDFQRNHVWTDEESAYLIDTVMNDLPFPEVYLRTITDEDDGTTRFEVVDGQQRIRALLRFAANAFDLQGEEISQKFLGKKFSTLNPAERKAFWRYSIVVRDLGESSDAEIRDIFRRLNKHSVKLNDQELRNAKFKGIFITTMEELADDNWWIDTRIVNPRQVRRMEDIEFVSELFIGLMAGPQNKKDSINKFYEAYERDFPDKEKHAKLFRDTKALIIDVLPETELRKWAGRSDFYSLFLSFSRFAESSFTAKKKKKLLSALVKFRTRVDEAKKKDAKPAKDKAVALYVEAVTRAASDIDRRRIRVNVLTMLIKRAAA